MSAEKAVQFEKNCVKADDRSTNASRSFGQKSVSRNGGGGKFTLLWPRGLGSKCKHGCRCGIFIRGNMVATLRFLWTHARRWVLVQVVRSFWKVSGFVAGFVVTVLCMSRRTVLHTLHARMFFSLARILHFALEVISCLHGCHTVAPPRLSIWSLPRSLTLIIKVLLLGFYRCLCELHTPPPLIPKVERTASTATSASVETVSK